MLGSPLFWPILVRRIATVTIWAPEASIARRVSSKSRYFPVPTSRRDEYDLPATTSGSFVMLDGASRPRTLAPSHGDHDLDAVALDQELVGEAAARHDLAVALDREALAGELERFEDLRHGGRRGELARCAVHEDADRCGHGKSIERSSPPRRRGPNFGSLNPRRLGMTGPSAARAATGPSHLLEPLGVRAAHRQLRAAFLEANEDPSAEVAASRGDGIHVDNGAPVDLPEDLGIELVGELGERGADEGLARARDDAGVLVGSLAIEHVVDRDLLHHLALERADPAQAPRGAAGDYAREAREHHFQRRGLLRRRELRAQPLDATREALVGEGLQDVVHRVAVESLDCVLDERGHEYHVGLRIDAARELEAREPRHADVEEGHLGRVLLDGA